MKTTILVILAIAMLIVNSACEKQNSEVAHIDLRIKATGNSELTTQKSGMISTKSFEIESALIYLERMELKFQTVPIEDEYENEEIEEGEHLFDGPFKVDLLNVSSDPEMPLVEAQPGIYTKFEAELYVPENLGHSVYISGTFSVNEAKSQKFIYTYSQTEDFKVENPYGIKITGDMVNYIVVKVNLNSLFEGVDFSLAKIDDDNIIRINKNSNNDLADIIENNLETASQMEIE